VSVFDFDPTVGEGGIDYLMFNDWKVKYDEQKRQRQALGAGPTEDDESTAVGDSTAKAD